MYIYIHFFNSTLMRPLTFNNVVTPMPVLRQQWHFMFSGKYFVTSFTSENFFLWGDNLEHCAPSLSSRFDFFPFWDHRVWVSERNDWELLVWFRDHIVVCIFDLWFPPRCMKRFSRNQGLYTQLCSHRFQPALLYVLQNVLCLHLLAASCLSKSFCWRDYSYSYVLEDLCFCFTCNTITICAVYS